MAQQITEAGQTLDAAAVDGKPGRFLVQIISPGWGSSGYYSEKTLKEAARSKVFPAGTRQMVDHPTWSESQERPVGQVLNWAATLVEDAHWDDKAGALVAEAEVYSPYAALLAERANWLGVSIRASAETHIGEAEGRKGVIIDELVVGESIDYVVKAGRGGKVLAVLESARNLSEATSNDRRDQLQRAVTDAHTSRDQDTYAWVRDFDEAAATVYFALNDDRTYAQAFEVADDDRAVTLTGDPAEVRVVTSYVPLTAAATESDPANPDPSAPAGQPTTESSEEMNMAEIADAELTQLRESAGQADANRVRAEKAEAELAESKARDGAAERARGLLKESKLPDAAKDRIVREAVRALPMKDGALDETVFDAAVKTAEATESAYVASLAPADGGRVTGFGQSAATEAHTGPLTNAWGREIKEY